MKSIQIYIHYFYLKSGGQFQGIDYATNYINDNFAINYDEHDIPSYFIAQHQSLANSFAKLAISITRLHLQSLGLYL